MAYLDRVARSAFPVTIMEFQERFATEDACRDYLFTCRWPEVFRRQRCGGGEIVDDGGIEGLPAKLGKPASNDGGSRSRHRGRAGTRSRRLTWADVRLTQLDDAEIEFGSPVDVLVSANRTAPSDAPVSAASVNSVR